MGNEENASTTHAQLEEAIGITHVKYDRFCELITAASEKHNRYLSSMTNDTGTWEQAIKDLDKQLSQKGRGMLTAQVAGDTAAVGQLSAEVEQINAQINDLRQRIYSYTKVDINEFLFDDMDEIRAALLDVHDEISVNFPLIQSHRENLRQQINELNQQIEDCTSLDIENRHLIDRCHDRLTRLMAVMFNLPPNDRSAFLGELKRAMGFFTHVLDTSTLASDQMREVYYQYKEGAYKHE